VTQSFTPKQSGCYLPQVAVSWVQEKDHEIWHSPVTQVHFVVDSRIKSRHTANAVLKQAGLPKHF